MKLREDAREVILRGRIWKDGKGGIHIGAIFGLSTGDCYFLGQHMDLIEELAPVRSGAAAPQHGAACKGLKELRADYDAALQAEWDFQPSGDAAADKRRRDEIELWQSRTYNAYHNALMRHMDASGLRPHCRC